MNRMLRISIFSLLISSAALAQDIRIGYMNPAQVLGTLDEVAQIEQQIQQIIQQRDQELQAKSQQLQQDFATYEEGRGILSEEARVAREQELMERNDALTEEQNTVLNEIRQRRLQLMTPVMERMDAAIQKVATARGLDLVLNEATSYGDAIIFYAVQENLNITQDVINELQSN